MTALATADLLGAWEEAAARPDADRPLALLAVGAPELTEEERGGLPIGARDARLLALLEHAFGTRLAAVVRCPSCDAELEFELDTSALRLPAAADTDDETLRVDDFEVCYRLPDALAVHHAAGEPTVAAARAALLQHCIASVRRDGAAVDLGAVPEEVLERVESAMSERDPQADVSVALSCAECGHGWEAAFDVARFLWAELDQWARRLLADVAILAAAFGWTETEVLRLTALRREAYLELAGR
jgi:hypothetical protein